MNLRTFTSWLQTKPIKNAVVILLLIFTIYIAGVLMKKDSSASAATVNVERENSPKSRDRRSLPDQPIVETLSDDALAAIPKSSPKPPEEAPKAAPVGPAQAMPIDNIPMTSTRITEKASVSDEFAPYGRMIQGTLRTTIMSSTIETPVIVVVTHPVYFKGKLIVPAGATIHCTASKGRENSRVFVQPKVLVNEFSGEEMPLKGQILTRDVSVNDDGQKTWGLYDATPGVLGELIKTDDMAEIKLFIATFMSAFIQAQESTYQNVITGQNIPQNNLKNAGLAGTAAVVNRYAEQILESIRKDGFFVLVPSGRDVWIYTEQTLDAADYTIGSTRISERKEARK